MIEYDFTRSQWLFPGTPPFSGQPWSPKYLKYFTIHWRGIPNSSAGKSEKTALNQTQIDYVNNRGYSFGYSSAVGLSGSKYEGRGTKYRAASNGDSTDLDDDLPGNPQLLDNLEVFSCLLIMGIPDKITSEMLTGVRELYASVCRELGKELEINGHNDLDYTGCPGPQAQAYVDQGLWYPQSSGVKDDMQTLRTPRRIIDTREGGSPVTGSKSFDIKSSAAAVIDAEITVTCIPTTAQAGFAGLNNSDSFCNWTENDKGVPIPQTLSVPVSSKKINLFFLTPCHVIITVRAEG